MIRLPPQTRVIGVGRQPQEGNGGGCWREGSLVDEGSSGEEEGSYSGYMGDIWLGEVGVRKRGQRKGYYGGGCWEYEGGW